MVGGVGAFSRAAIALALTHLSATDGGVAPVALDPQQLSDASFVTVKVVPP